MTASRNNTNPEALHDLVVAVASAEGTIADHILLCQLLWQDANHQPWLSAALMRRISLFETLDEATAQFLAARVQEELVPGAEGRLPDNQTLADTIPALVDLLPEDVWQEPWSAWRNLLVAIHEEYELPPLPPEIPTAEVPDERARTLASLFAAAVGQPWTDQLEERLRRLVSSPDYPWLVALRRAARLTQLLDMGTSASAKPLFESNDLAEQLAALPAYDRTRWLMLKIPSTKKTIWAEPIISQDSRTATWRFDVPVATNSEVSVELIAARQPVGQVRFLRDKGGMVRIEDAAGLLDPLAKIFSQPMPVVRAASEKNKNRTPVTQHLTVSVEPTTDSVVFSLCWSR